MISIETLINDVCETLGGSEITKGITFIPEFPARKQDLPLKHPVVSVGIERVGANPMGESLTLTENGSPCTVRIRLLICVPKSAGGNTCHRVLDKVMSACALLLPKYQVLKFYTGTMKYSTVITGLVLPFDIIFDVGNAFGNSQIQD